MGKIYCYECRRLLWNKFFVGLAVVLLLYGGFTLCAVTLLGVSHTAPFSPWSFGDYLCRMLPLQWIGMQFFLTFFTSRGARRAAALTDAAPMDPRRYALARCAAALTGGLLLALLCMGEAAVLYGPCCRPWCSPWAAGGCWGGSAPGLCMSGCWPPSPGRRCRCPRPWVPGTDGFSASIR